MAPTERTAGLPTPAANNAVALCGLRVRMPL